MVEKYMGLKDLAEVLKGLLLCMLLLPVGILFLILGTLTGLAELILSDRKNGS